MAQASGLQLLKKVERNCLKTSTYGTGEMIKHAIHQGAKKIILAIVDSYYGCFCTLNTKLNQLADDES